MTYPTFDRQATGQRLRACRLERGLTQAQLAELSGVSVVTICNTERGNCTARLDGFALLCAVLECKTDELIVMRGTQPQGRVPVQHTGEH